MKFTPQLVVAMLVLVIVGVFGVLGTVSADTALSVMVSIAGAFGLGASHASASGTGTQ